MKKIPLRKQGKSATSQAKQRIQALLRQIVIKRDKTCILRHIRQCEDSVLQADHLITRANSATFADLRLVVCLCRSCHGGFKQWHKEQYDALVKTILPKDRVKLWEKCQADSWIPKRTSAYDWRIAEAVLNQELKKYN